MVRRYGGIFITKESRWLFIFFIGLLMGTFFFNLWGKNSLEEFVLYRGILKEKYTSTLFSYTALFFYILWKRGKRLAILIALEFTMFEIPALLLYTIYYGFAAGAFLSSFVMQDGLQGIFSFFIWIFPHYIAYGILWWVLTTKKEKWNFGKRLFIIVGVLLLGVCMETFLNTMLIQKIWQ